MTRKIVILARSLPHHALGGMEVVAWDLAKTLVRLGYAVQVITTALPSTSSASGTSSGISRNGEFEEDGVVITPLNDAPSARYTRGWWRQARRYFADNCMTDVHAVISISAAGFSLLPLKRQLIDVPFIMQAHGTSWGEIVSKLKSRRLLSFVSAVRNVIWIPKDLAAYAKFDAVVAVGEPVYHDLTRAPAKWAIPNAKVELINNGIDSEKFSPSAASRAALRAQLGFGPDTPIVVSANRLHVQKGIAHGLNAFSRMLARRPDAVYFILGDGPERKRLEEMAAQLGISGSVRFLGAIARSDVVKWLQIADVFLFLTDRIEGLPLNLLEALACGVPLIVSKHIGIFESTAINHVSQRDIDMVASTMETVIANGASGRTSYLPDEFTLNTSAGKYVRLIERLRSK